MHKISLNYFLATMISLWLSTCMRHYCVVVVVPMYARCAKAVGWSSKEVGGRKTPMCLALTIFRSHTLVGVEEIGDPKTFRSRLGLNVR